MPGSESYNDQGGGISLRSGKGQRALEEAGYGDGCTITATGSGSEAESFFTLIQAYLAEVGITLEIDLVDSAVYNAKRMVAGDDTYNGLISLQGAAVKERYLTCLERIPPTTPEAWPSTMM